MRWLRSRYSPVLAAVVLAACSPERLPQTASPGEIGGSLGEYHALVIANEDYREFEPLDTATRDGRELAAVLGRDYGFSVSVLENATREDVFIAFDKLRRELDEEDNLLIYYAGHGYLDERTEHGYWLPVDASPKHRSNWIGNTEVRDELLALSAKHVLVVADSCYAGTLMRSIRENDETARATQRLARRRARIVLTSGGLEPVVDGGGQGHSVFARHLLNILRDNTGVLSSWSLFDELREHVINNADQTPEYGVIHKAGHAGGDFLFAKREPAIRRARSIEEPPEHTPVVAEDALRSPAPAAGTSEPREPPPVAAEVPAVDVAPAPREGPAEAGYRRDHPASKKIEEAVQVYLSTDFDKAEGILQGTIRACEDKCRPGTIARAWMYIGIVRGSGKSDASGSVEAFGKALAAAPDVQLDRQLATPATAASFDALKSRLLSRAVSSDSDVLDLDE